MPLTLEQRLALEQLGINPILGEDNSTGGLYGMPDAMSPGGLREDPRTRDFRNRSNPARFSQPQLGPFGAPAAPVVNEDDQRAQAMRDLASMQAAAPGILEGLAEPGSPFGAGVAPSRSSQVVELLGRPGLSDEQRRNLAYAGLNSGAGMKQQIPYEFQHQYTDERLADVAARQAAVESNAADRGAARRMRMGDGPGMMLNRQMDMIAQLGGGGGQMNPMLGAAAGLPPALIAEANEQTRFNRSMALQERQTQNAENDDARRVVANTPGSTPRQLVGVGKSDDDMALWDAQQAAGFMAQNPTASRDQLEATLIQQGVDPMTAGTQAFLLRSKYPGLFPQQGPGLLERIHSAMGDGIPFN